MPVTPIQNSKGFTLIEVLIAALVLGIGILGLATTMLLGLKSDQSAYFRSQASALAYDMADRIRANRSAATSYNGVDSNGTIAASTGCDGEGAGCSNSQRAREDIRQWAMNFTNVDSLSGYAPKLPNGRGTISRDSAGRYVISVSWSEADWNGSSPTQKTMGTESLSVSLEL
jgi:type IV pilus assembly protein PilV